MEGKAKSFQGIRQNDNSEAASIFQYTITWIFKLQPHEWFTRNVVYFKGIIGYCFLATHISDSALFSEKGFLPESRLPNRYFICARPLFPSSTSGPVV